MFADDALAHACSEGHGMGTVLHAAAKAGKLSVAQALLDTGANVSIKDPLGFTALKVAEAPLHQNFAIARVVRARDIKCHI